MPAFRRLSLKLGLLKARDLVATRWTSGMFAQNAHGGVQMNEHTADPTTCKFCAVGALRNVFGSHHHPNYVKALDVLNPHAARRLKRAKFSIGSDIEGNVIRVNDFLGQRSALGMFDRAIAELPL